MWGSISNMEEWMPRAQLEFNLPEEEEDFRHACNGLDYYGALRAVDERLRNRLKYETLPLEVAEALEGIRTFMREFIPQAFA